jgi:hypothetical protein
MRGRLPERPAGAPALAKPRPRHLRLPHDGRQPGWHASPCNAGRRPTNDLVARRLQSSQLEKKPETPNSAIVLQGARMGSGPNFAIEWPSSSVIGRPDVNFRLARAEMADGIAQRWFMRWACAASLALQLVACSTAGETPATEADRAGFVPSSSTGKSTEPTIVTAGELMQQKAAPDQSAAQRRDGAEVKSTQTGFELSASQVKALIAHSRAEFSGECPCPYDVDNAGRGCGRRSAYSRTGASAVLCYPRDVVPN